jgi:exopolyphosphatase/guanosine-5'-triphosphate,3'-diphosphate pyrophosphatase
VKVAVIDVGANTIRLLVAAASDGRIRARHERKARVGLGEAVERHGRVPPSMIAEAASTVAAFAATARALGCDRIVVAAASPGRQAANAPSLVAGIERAAGLPVEVLSAEAEATFAWDGALSHAGAGRGSVLVCDVGGGSTQLAFGSANARPSWLHSLDLGSLRLTTRLLTSDPTSKKVLAAAAAEVAGAFDGLLVPVPERAFVAGGTARALRKLARGALGAAELEQTVKLLRRRTSAELAAEFRLDLGRARTLAAGAVIVRELQRRIGVPLAVAPAGLREGLALALLARPLAA